MSTRSIRRAAERKAAKAARKEGRLAHPSSEEQTAQIGPEEHHDHCASADDRNSNSSGIPAARPAPEWFDRNASTAFEQSDSTETARDADADWSTNEAEPHTAGTTVRPNSRARAWKPLTEIRQLTFVTHDHPTESSVPADPIDSDPDSPADQPIPEARPAKPVTPARLVANTANAQRSTGPRTAEGKAKSRLNAVRTGLTGRTVLLPADDAAIYRRHVQDFVDEFQPVGPRESELVQTLADHSWRLDRIASLEMAFYAHGLEQFHEQFASRGELQGAFVQMHTFLQYEKQFRNLQVQEMRIRRNREKDTAELHRLQHARLYPKREVTVKQVVIPQAPRPESTNTRNASTNGFDFSSSNKERESEAPRTSFRPAKPNFGPRIAV
jgi:hypothetical protein